MMQPKFKLESATARLQGGRPYQADTFDVYDDLFDKERYAMYSVFDGHVTSKYADYASKTLPQIISESLEFAKGNYKTALAEAFLIEDGALKRDESSDKGGTTATVALVTPDRLYVANVGNSRCIMGRQFLNDYETLRCTKDHLVKDPCEFQRIQKSGGVVVAGRVASEEYSVAVSHALGDFDLKEPETKSDLISAIPFVSDFHLSRRVQFLVLATDGLWERMTDNEVLDYILRRKEKGQTLQQITEALAKRAASQPNSDNVTIILVWFHYLKNTCQKENESE